MGRGKGRVMSAFCSFPHFRISICDSLRLAVEEHAQGREKGWGEADWAKGGGRGGRESVEGGCGH